MGTNLTTHADKAPKVQFKVLEPFPREFCGRYFTQVSSVLAYQLCQHENHLLDDSLSPCVLLNKLGTHMCSLFSL